MVTLKSPADIAPQSTPHEEFPALSGSLESFNAILIVKLPFLAYPRLIENENSASVSAAAAFTIASCPINSIFLVLHSHSQPMQNSISPEYD